MTQLVRRLREKKSEYLASVGKKVVRGILGMQIVVCASRYVIQGSRDVARDAARDAASRDAAREAARDVARNAGFS